MAHSQGKKENVYASGKYKVVYEYRSIFGIISSWEVKSAEKVDDDLYVIINNIEKFDNIYINGVKLSDNFKNETHTTKKRYEDDEEVET